MHFPRLLVMATVVFSAFVTSSTVRYACEYPGCTCNDVDTTGGFQLTCHIQHMQDTLLPRNRSLNIVTVEIHCTQSESDLMTFLDRIKQDLQNMKSLSIYDCVTSYSAVVERLKLLQVKNIMFQNVIFTDGAENDVRYRLPSLDTLHVTNTQSCAVVDVCQLIGVTHLQISGCESIYLPYNCTDGGVSSNITVLDLSHNNISVITPLVVSFSELTQFSVQFNNISSLEDDVFQKMPNLTILDLSSNRLVSLPDDLLLEQSSLKHLNLSYNQLTVLPRGLLSHTVELTSLDLSHNNIKYLSSKLFQKLANLRILNISSNQISFLMKSQMDILVSLEYLELGNNSLSSIPPLTSCAQLQILSASNNKITHINEGTFTGLSHLKGISYSHNRLTRIRLVDIAMSKHLQKLDFSYNEIRYLAFGSTVDVRSNRLINDSLSVLRSVIYLDLTSNKLRDIYRLGKYFNGLQYLLLSQNEIGELTVADVPRSLKVLFVDNNRIYKIESNMFKTMPDLQMVNMINNYPNLYSLPSYLIQISPRAIPKPRMYISGNLFLCDCRMGYLKTYHDVEPSKQPFFLRNNIPIIADLEEVVCSTINELRVQKFVDVSLDEFMCLNAGFLCETACGCCGQISCSCYHICPSACSCQSGGSPWDIQVHRVVCDNSSLTNIPVKIPPPTTHLQLEYNNITELQENSFPILGSLTHLYLSDSNISVLHPGCFRGLPALNKLHLEYNHLSRLSKDLWEGLTNLTHLYLQHNLISSLSPGLFQNLKSLLYLDLSNNLLTKVTSFSFPLPTPPLPSRIKLLNITHNPFSCACEAMEFTLSFVTLYATSVSGLDDLTCVVPEIKVLHDFLKVDINTSFKLQSTDTVSKRVNFKDFDVESCNKRVLFVNESKYHKHTFKKDDRYIIAMSVVLVVLVLVVLSTVILYRKRRSLQTCCSHHAIQEDKPRPRNTNPKELPKSAPRLDAGPED